MANSAPPLRDSASIFNTIYTDPDERFGSGIKNARSERGVREQTLHSRPSEDGRRKRPTTRLYRGPQEVSDFTDTVSPRQQMLDNRYYPDPGQQLQTPANTNTAPQKKKVATSLLARARGISFGFVTIGWLVPVYFFWQLPISIVGSIMLGLSLQVEASYLLSAANTASQVVGSLFGYEYVDLTAIGMLAVITAAGFGVISACIAGFTAILWGLHPLSGNAAGTKTALFIVGVVGACIPFANMFPWIIFWILVMRRHPK